MHVLGSGCSCLEAQLRPHRPVYVHPPSTTTPAHTLLLFDTRNCPYTTATTTPCHTLLPPWFRPALLHRSGGAHHLHRRPPRPHHPQPAADNLEGGRPGALCCLRLPVWPLPAHQVPPQLQHPNTHRCLLLAVRQLCHRWRTGPHCPPDQRPCRQAQLGVQPARGVAAG